MIEHSNYIKAAKRERIYAWFLRMTKRLNERQMLAILAVVVGALAGFGTYLFELLLYAIKSCLVNWFDVDTYHFLYFIYPALGIVLATLFVKYIVKDNISEGVTRVLYAMSRRGSRIAGHNCWTSIVGGATTIGFGGSVGPEAPIVLTGAAIGSNVGKLARLNYRNITLLLCCGAGAALAAVFKAPITGVVFVLEILMLDITSASVIPLLISSITATTIALVLRGFDPIIAVTLTEADAFQIRQIPLFIVLGVLCGLMSYYFTQTNATVGSRIRNITGQYKRWIVGGVILGVLIFIFPPLYGEGYEGFLALMHGNEQAIFENSLFYPFKDIGWVLLIYVIAVMFFKVVAMATTNAAGGVGGTFAPSLFVGAFTGAALAIFCNLCFGWEVSVASFTLVGMAGVMAGVMNAPLTSIFLIAELSNGYGLFIPLMIVACIAFAVDYYLDPDSIYTKSLRKKGELLTHDKDQSVFVFLKLEELMDRLRAHQGELHARRHSTHHRLGTPQHIPRHRQFRASVGRSPVGRPARRHVQAREMGQPDYKLHDSAARQDSRKGADTERTAAFRTEPHMDASGRGPRQPLPRIHLEIAHPQRLSRAVGEDFAVKLWQTII